LNKNAKNCNKGEVVLKVRSVSVDAKSRERSKMLPAKRQHLGWEATLFAVQKRKKQQRKQEERWAKISANGIFIQFR
jgi:hypothetical protein